MAEKIVLTQADRQRLMDELRWLETAEHPRCLAELEAAKELGDLSENAEYEAALLFLTRTEKRMQSLRQLLEQADDAQSGSDGSGNA